MRKLFLIISSLCCLVSSGQSPLKKLAHAPLYDYDAQAYIARVQATGVILTPTEKTAINTFVLGLKSNSLWVKIYEAWPIIGGTANAHAETLKAVVTDVVWNGGLTHSATGVDPNGSTGYGNLGVVPSASIALNDMHYSFYSREDLNAATVDMGSFGGAGPRVRIATRLSGNIQYIGHDATSSTVATANSLGFYVLNRAASTTKEVFKNGASAASVAVTSTGRPAQPLYIGAENNSGTAVNFSAREFCFASVGASMTSGEQTIFFNLVEALQDALSRGVVP